MRVVSQLTLPKGRYQLRASAGGAAVAGSVVYVLTIFAEAYEDRKKPHTVTFSLELRDEAGTVIGSHVIERTVKERPRQASAYAFAPTLLLEDVPPGRYVLHADARSSLDRNKRVVRDIPFTVR